MTPQGRRGGCAGIFPLVIAGLDPAIHRLRKTLAKMMDTRVKPAYGAQCVAVIASEAKQSRSRAEGLDCFVASAPRNDNV
jgi:hypothetical protein